MCTAAKLHWKAQQHLLIHSSNICWRSDGQRLTSSPNLHCLHIRQPTRLFSSACNPPIVSLSPYRSSHQVLPRCHHSRTTIVGNVKQRRLQHAQALPKYETHDEDHGQEDGQDKVKSVEDVDLEVEGSGFENALSGVREDNGATLDRLRRLMQTDSSKASDQLLSLITTYLPHATPVIRLRECAPLEDEEGFEDSKRSFRLELSNQEYKISCSQTVNLSHESQGSFVDLFEELTQKYIFQIAKHPEANKVLEQDVKPYHMQRLHSILDIDTLSIECVPVELEGAQPSNLSLFRAQVYSGHEPLGQSQIWSDSGTAERLACASADVEVLIRAEQAGVDLNSVRLSSNLVPASRRKRSYELQRASDQDGTRVYSASLSHECLSAMLYTLHNLRVAGLPDEVSLQPLKPLLKPRSPFQSTKIGLHRRSREMQIQALQEEITPFRQSILEERNKLPIRQPRIEDHIHRLVRANHVFVLVSETGSGKTTQLPQILLERAIADGKGTMCNIICTQPRRIAASSAASRVAQERGTYVGGSVGYQVRFDRQLSTQKGSINYSTAGALLKKLQNDLEEVMSQTSHIIVDEIHERDLTVDLLLALLRDTMRKRLASKKPCPRIILMSATMKSIDFERYFAEPHEGFTPRVASITIPGRAYAVTTHMLDEIIPTFSTLYNSNAQTMALLRSSHEYLEWEDEFAAEKGEEEITTPQLNQTIESTEQQEASPETGKHSDPVRDATIPYPLISATVAHILTMDEWGDILIFLPGMKEIDMLAAMLASHPQMGREFSNPDKIRVFRLHSALYGTNAKVFEPVPPNCRRVILATNIAQTSITLPDVVHVIDSGKRREMAHDQVSRKNEFTSTWIDKATSFQRRGRAGRVQSGHYWAMFTDARFQSMPDRASPEMLISDLTTSSLVLKSHSNDINLQQFFAATLDPPNSTIVAASINELKEMGMLTNDEKITALGKFCSDFPLHPAKARGLLLGLLFGCFQPLMTIASHNSMAPLIHSPTNRREMYRSTLQFASASDDDRFAYIHAFLQYDRAVRSHSVEDIALLESQNVRPDAYHDMLTVARQLFEMLNEYGLLRGKDVASLGKKDSVFRLVHPSNNVNADCLPLMKALALSVVDTNLAVWDEAEKSWLAKDIKCVLKPYSVTTMQSLDLLDRVCLRKSGELVGFSEMVRNVIASPRPFLVESSSITPLMAMLFGGPIHIIDDNTIEIDGWLRYEVKLGSTTNENADAQLNLKSPVMVIVEFRKAIDRFLTLAFSDLRNISRLTEEQRHQTKYIQMFLPGRLRDTMRDGLIAVLEADAQHWDNVLQPI